MKSTYSRTVFTITILSVILGLFIRCYFLFNHFTNCDDIGVAITIINHSTLFGKLRSFADWTYAPFQYILDVPLLYIAKTYQSIIAIGRVPSLIFGVLSIFLCHYLLSKQYCRKEIVFFGDVLLALSWEIIIYSAQMQPYVISVALGFLLLIVLMYWERKELSEKKLCLITTIAAVLSCYSQYQLFLVVFAFYLAIFLSSIIRKNRRETKYIMVSGMVTVMLCLPLLYILLKGGGMLGRGVNIWNVGLHREFLLDVTQCDGFIDCCLYVFAFFVRNTFLVIKYYFTTDFAYLSNILSFALSCFFAIGLVRTVRSVFIKKDLGSIFISILVLCLLFLIITGKQVLGPSRHLMFLAPYFMMLILNGLQLTIQVIKSTKVVKSLLLSLFFLEFVPFTASAYGEMKDRSNKISQSVMNNIVETYHPDAILGCKSRCYDFYLLNLDGYNNQPKWCVYSLLLKNGTSSFKSGDKIVVMSNVKIEGSDVYKSIELIENDIFSDFLSNYTLSLISSEESVTNCAPYYASKYYNVTSNGSCIYVYEISEKE